MADLLFWNTLTESANWLSETLGEKVTPQSLIQKILDQAKSASKPNSEGLYPPTVIKAVMPRGLQFASVWIIPKKDDAGEFELRTHERMTKAHGTPCFKDSVYTGYISASAIPLYRGQIADLIIYGNVEIFTVMENQLGGYKFREFEFCYPLPVGTKHIATIETCGINRDDLLALANQLSASGIAQAGDAQTSASQSNQNSKELKPDEPWIVFCKSQIDDIYQSRIAMGKACGVGYLAEELVGRCKRKDYITKRNKPVSKDNVLKQVLNGWTAPEIE